MTNVLEVKAKLASEEAGRTITPEQYQAVDYFAKEEVLARRAVKNISPEFAEKLENNARKSWLKIGILDNFVADYHKEMKDPDYQSHMRVERRARERQRHRQMHMMMMDTNGHGVLN